MRVRKRQGSTRELAPADDQVQIDMNPMVDLAFLLLTFFMLTTTFAKPKIMEVRMPVKTASTDVEQEQPVKESRAVTLMLGADNEIYWFRGVTEPQVAKTTFEPEGIRQVMEDMKAEITDMVVLIKPTDDSNFENLVDILDEMNRSEVKRYAVVDIAETDLELIRQFEAAQP